MLGQIPEGPGTQFYYLVKVCKVQLPGPVDELDSIFNDWL